MEGFSVDSFDVFLFDCDGVLFRGSSAIPGAAEVLLALNAAGKRCFFVTNNATKSREDNAVKLRDLGIPAKAEQVICSSFSAARYVQSLGLKRVFVVGESGIVDELKCAALEVCEDASEAVVVGLDRSFSYDKMSRALAQLQQGAVFIATNRDSTYPADGGKFLPGAGSVVAALECCAGRSPVVVGKPEPWFESLVKSVVGTPAERCIMVGDRLDTDIQFGNISGFQTLLVTTTGVNNVEDLQNAPSHRKATFHTPSVSDLRRYVGGPTK